LAKECVVDAERFDVLLDAALALEVRTPDSRSAPPTEL
jgi:hypothetical protein